MEQIISMRVRDRAVLRAYLRLVPGSDRALAVRAGLSHSTLNHLLTGHRLTCSPETARAIETALGCEPGLFFERWVAPEQVRRRELPPVRRSSPRTRSS